MTPRQARRRPASEAERPKAPLKVCAIGLRGLPGVMGGVETHCESLYPRMIEQDPDLEITVLGRGPYLQHGNRTHEGVRVISVWAVRNKHLETLLHTLVAILYARFVVRPDILHLHAIGPGLLCPLARLLGMPVVLTHHGADYDRAKWGWLAKAVLRLGESLAVRFANRTIVVGRSLSQELKARFSTRAERIEFIPNGLPDRHVGSTGAPKYLDPVGTDLLQTFGLVADNYILTVGRLVPEKGFQDLIAAYKVANPARKLVIVGGSDHEDRFYRELHASASDRIVFTGFQSGAALDAIRQNAAVFVLPSHHEGMPIAALEVLAIGLPVLLSDIQPNVDIGLPEGCYFETGNVEDLAAKLSVTDYGIYRSPSRELLQAFDWSKIAIGTLRTYRSIVVDA